MSDISKISPVKLDPAAIQRAKVSAVNLDALEKQAIALEKLGIVMTPIRQQLDWARKAQETLLKDFT